LPWKHFRFASVIVIRICRRRHSDQKDPTGNLSNKKCFYVCLAPVSGSFYLHFEKKNKRNVFEFYLDGLSGFRIFIRLIVRQHFQQQLLFEFD
jgi:hypothetical protein